MPRRDATQGCHAGMLCPFLLGSEPLGSTARGRVHCQQSLGLVARGRWHITRGTFRTDTAVHVVSAVVAPSPQSPPGQDRRTGLKAPVHSKSHILPHSNEAFVHASPIPIHRMADRLLSCSRVVLEENGSPQESSSQVEPHDVTTEQPPQPGSEGLCWARQGWAGDLVQCQDPTSPPH